MSDFIQFKISGMAQEAVQSLLEGKRAARTLENICDGLLPVLENKETIAKLESIREAAAKAAHVFQSLYNTHAREHFGQPRDRGRTPRHSTDSTGDKPERQTDPENQTPRDLPTSHDPTSEREG